MENSPSWSTPNSSDTAEREYVRDGNARLPVFRRYNLSHSSVGTTSDYSEYISIAKLRQWESADVRTRYADRRYGTDEKETKVVCYLLGRAFTGPTLKVWIQSPWCLEPLCVGLNANPIEVNLHIHMDGSDGPLVESLEHIAPFLKRSSFMRGIRISSSDRLRGYGSYIAEAVRTSKLHELDISYMGGNKSSGDVSFHENEGKQFSEALTENTSIKVLGVKAVPSIVRSFVWQDLTAANRSVEHMTLMFVDGHRYFWDLTAVLTTNQALSRIRLLNADFSQGMWMQIVDSLKKNSFLQELDIGRSSGWIDEAFLRALLKLIGIHGHITDLGFNDLPQDLLRNDVIREALPALNEQLRLNTEYGQALKTAARGPPRSARVVLCGPGYAGKTTLCRTMMNRKGRWLRGQLSLSLQKRPALRRFLYGPEAHLELNQRTRGVDMHLWRDEGELRISLWDFAGQKEYYALHDYLFPNVNSANLFLFTFSLRPNPFDFSGQIEDEFARIEVIETELLFWLRFLCSNSKEVSDPKPRVRVVLTGVDKVTQLAQWRFRIDAIFEKMKVQFENRLDLVGPVMLLNAHSKGMVKELEEKIFEDFADLVPRLEPTFTICEEVRRNLVGKTTFSGLRSPVITVEEYDQICLKVDRNMLHKHEMRQAVASYLHNVGEIMYFSNLNFIVVDPRWLGLGVLGNLLDVFGRRCTIRSKGVIGSLQDIGRSSNFGRIYLKNGFVDPEGLRTLLNDSLRSVTRLTGMKPDDLIKLLGALEICYEDEARKGYLIPAALDDEKEEAVHGLRALSWREVTGPQTYKFIGRRLQCADQDLTVLTPGFFPRLQVVLRNHLVEKRIIVSREKQEFDGFEIDRNLLRFIHNTMDIIVEYGEGEQFRSNFVDVLVRTSRDHTSTVDFIEEHVLNVIRKYCAQPEGNQGVLLVEGIIRPASVEHLILCKHRENQAVLIRDLEEHVNRDIFHQFCWNAVPSGGANPNHSCSRREYKYAIDALYGEGSHEEIRQSQLVDAEAISGMFQRFKEPLKGFLGNLVHDQVLPDTPKLVYILEDRRVYLRGAQSEVRLRLHLQCEWKDGPHVVQEQRGRSFVVEDEAKRTLTPLLQWTYSMCKLAGLVVGKTVPFFGALEVAVGLLPDQIPRLPSAFFNNNTLQKMGMKDKEDIIQYYSKILKESPCCEWLKEFLDLEGNLENFKTDFKLQKVRYRDSQETAFLCESCRIIGFTKNILQLP